MNLFSEYLAETLNIEDTYLIEELNDDIIELIVDDPGFQGELEKTLYKNEQKLTHSNFLLDGKPHSPTPGNWLKDFIKKNGSAKFNDLVLVKYLTDSENAKALSSEDRKALRKFFSMYYNLKFFPSSMMGIMPEQWEIFPVNREMGRKAPSGKLGAPKTEIERQVDELKESLKQYDENSLEYKATKEEIGKLEKREMMSLYPEGSLERQAIKEEINAPER